MPNWCSNEIKIFGTKEDIGAFKQYISKSKIPFDFNLFLPYPEEFKVLDDAYAEAEAAEVPWDKLPKSGYEQGGYDWCISQWGTKWNLEDASVNRDGDEDLSGYFDTAWAPPLGVIRAMSAMFPNLTITINYSEEGMDFEGFATYQNGEVIESGEHEYEDDDEEDKDDEDDNDDDDEDDDEEDENYEDDNDDNDKDEEEEERTVLKEDEVEQHNQLHGKCGKKMMGHCIL